MLWSLEAVYVALGVTLVNVLIYSLGVMYIYKKLLLQRALKAPALKLLLVNTPLACYLLFFNGSLSLVVFMALMIIPLVISVGVPFYTERSLFTRLVGYR